MNGLSFFAPAQDPAGRSPDNSVVAHASGGYADYVGTCFEGDYDVERTMPNAQKKAGKELIAHLKAFDCGNVDGDFRVKTKASVIAYQKAKGRVVDGIVGRFSNIIINLLLRNFRFV